MGETERERIERIIREATTNWTPDNRTIEQINAERAAKKQERTLQRVGAALLRTFRRLS